MENNIKETDGRTTRCPGCGHRLSVMLSVWMQDNCAVRFRCPACGKRAAAAKRSGSITARAGRNTG